MSTSQPSWVRRYGVAVLATLAALLAKELLGTEIVPSAFLTFYAAVLVSAVVGGFSAGLLSTAIAAVLGTALYLPLDRPVSALRLVSFLGAATAMSWIIARRRSAQAEVAESEMRLRRLVESDMIGVVFWEQGGGITDANDEFLRMVGYTRDDLRAGRIRWRDLTPPEFAHLDDDALRQISATGSCAPFEKEYRHRDGTRVPIVVGRAATTSARDRGISFVLDISERKRMEVALRQAKEELEVRVAERTAELLTANRRLEEELAERLRIAQALRESEERYRQVSEVTSDYAYSLRIEANGRVVFEWYTGAFERITGFAQTDISSLRGIMELIHPDDRPALVQRMTRLLAGETVVTDFRMRTKPGEYRWLRDRGRPQWDATQGRVVRIVGAASDVTEAKHAEEALRESEERFSLAVAGANDGVWDWRMDVNEVYLSPRWKAILGLAPEDLGTDPQGWVERLHPGDADRVAAEVAAHLEGRTPDLHVEYRLRHRDGSYRWVLSRGVAVRDASGKAYRMAGSLTDITPRKQAEEEARRRQAELAHAQRVSTLGEMAAGLAHELNQPLAAIVSYASGCERRIQKGDVRSNELLYAISQVSKQALRAGDVLQRYRTFVRAGTTRREPVDLNALAHEVAELAKTVADEERIEIHVDSAPDLPEVMADSVQIEQVLVNLIRNALDSMHGGGPGQVWVRTRRAGDAVEVTVEDVGPGIPDELREQIFDAFFTTKGEGLGMGLSISRSIIDAHGGRLWPTPRPGRGTIFHFTVPIEALPADTAEDVERLRRRG